MKRAATKKSSARQLGALLRQRRERMIPADFGFDGRRRRRTPGLRREEVAELCGISVDWYIRLEQGRESLPSRATIDSLVRGMRLGVLDGAHLANLALHQTPRAFVKETVAPSLRALVEGLETAAYVVGLRYDLLCWNRAAVALFRDFAKVPESERNTLYQMFTSAAVRARYPDWKTEARAMLEGFRLTYDLWSHSPEFNELVERLDAQSPEFARWWKTHDLRKRAAGDKVMTHPRRGTLRVSYATFQSDDNPDLKLVLYGAPRPIAKR
jgi:transcriptional regulator with XRE-family HTH domain